MQMKHSSNLVILGLGLLGGSYARGLHKAGFDCVYAIDMAQDSIDDAKQQGYICDGKTCDFEEWRKQAGYMVLVLYPIVQKEWRKRWGYLLRDGCICTEVAGLQKNGHRYLGLPMYG